MSVVAESWGHEGEVGQTVLIELAVGPNFSRAEIMIVVCPSGVGEGAEEVERPDVLVGVSRRRTPGRGSLNKAARDQSRLSDLPEDVVLRRLTTGTRCAVV